MDSNKLFYFPLVEQQNVEGDLPAPQVYPSPQQPYPPPQQGGSEYAQQYSAPPQQYISSHVYSQPYPQPEEYSHQFVSPQQGYTQQGYPLQQVYAPQTPSEPPVFTSHNVFVPEDLAPDAALFVPTSDPPCTQLAKVPKYMVTAIMHPRVDTYKTLKMNASWFVVLFLLFSQSIVNATIAVIGNSISTGMFSFALVLINMVDIPMFFILQGTIYGLSRCIGGQHPELVSHPTFMQFCFVTIIISLPLDIISYFGALIPVAIIAWLIYIAILVYHLVLIVLTMRGVFHLTVGQAVAVIAVFVLALIMFAVLLLMLFGEALVFLLAGFSSV
jgi:hypothetical protein